MPIVFLFFFNVKYEQSSVYWGGFSETFMVEGLKSFWQKYVENQNAERGILILDDSNSSLGYVQAVFEDSTIGSMGSVESDSGKDYGKRIIAMSIDYYKNCKSFIALSEKIIMFQLSASTQLALKKLRILISSFLLMEKAIQYKGMNCIGEEASGWSTAVIFQ